MICTVTALVGLLTVRLADRLLHVLVESISDGVYHLEMLYVEYWLTGGSIWVRLLEQFVSFPGIKVSER